MFPVGQDDTCEVEERSFPTTDEHRGGDNVVTTTTIVATPCSNSADLDNAKSTVSTQEHPVNDDGYDISSTAKDMGKTRVKATGSGTNDDVEPPLEEGSKKDDVDDVILYPAGGAFNKLRKKQQFLESLLKAHWYEYSQTSTNLKKEYVMTNILDPIFDSGRQFQICNHINDYTIPSIDVVYERMAQKLRDTKKAQTRNDVVSSQPNDPTKPPSGSESESAPQRGVAVGRTGGRKRKQKTERVTTSKQKRNVRVKYDSAAGKGDAITSESKPKRRTGSTGATQDGKKVNHWYDDDGVASQVGDGGKARITGNSRTIKSKNIPRPTKSRRDNKKVRAQQQVTNRRRQPVRLPDVLLEHRKHKPSIDTEVVDPPRKMKLQSSSSSLISNYSQETTIVTSTTNKKKNVNSNTTVTKHSNYSAFTKLTTTTKTMLDINNNTNNCCCCNNNTNAEYCHDCINQVIINIPAKPKLRFGRGSGGTLLHSSSCYKNDDVDAYNVDWSDDDDDDDDDSFINETTATSSTADYRNNNDYKIRTRSSNNKNQNNNSISLEELKEVVWSQWEQIDSWRRLCCRYKETYHIQRAVILQQDKLLSSSVSLLSMNNNGNNSNNCTTATTTGNNNHNNNNNIHDVPSPSVSKLNYVCLNDSTSTVFDDMQHIQQHHDLSTTMGDNNNNNTLLSSDHHGYEVTTTAATTTTTTRMGVNTGGVLQQQQHLLILEENALRCAV